MQKLPTGNEISKALGLSAAGVEKETQEDDEVAEVGGVAEVTSEGN